MMKALQRALKFRLKRSSTINVYHLSQGTSSIRENNLFQTNFLNHKRYFSDEVNKAKQATRTHEATIFDKIISKEIKADVIYEDEKCLAFNDISPQAPVHFLVIPKKRIAKLDECSKDDAETIGNLILTAKMLAQKKLPNGYRLVINNGVDGAQSVYHLHVHILGGRQMSWPPG